MLNYYLNPRKKNERDFISDFFVPGFFPRDVEQMRTDVTERENDYLLEVALPGYNKENVKISLDDGYLKVEATKTSENKDESKKYVSREIYYGTQARSYYVGNIDQNKIKANFNNGILEVSVPKDELPEEDKTNYITID